jgi:hypothetical protein
VYEERDSKDDCFSLQVFSVGENHRLLEHYPVVTGGISLDKPEPIDEESDEDVIEQYRAIRNGGR